MAKKVLQAHYFADDKDIFDLLSAARQKLTPQKLVDFARCRGVILSASDDRDTLVDKLALLPFGWPDLQKLIEATDTAERAERSTSRSLAGTFDLDQVLAVAEKIKAERESRGETISFDRTEKTLRVRVTYSEVEPTSTRLLQRTRREFTLEFEPRTESMLVRHQAQARASEMLNAIASALSATGQTRIELSGVKNHALRTAFFLQLIRGVEGFTFTDVKAVKASPLPKEGAEDDEASDDDEPTPADEMDEDDPDAIDAEQAEFVAYVKDLALKGEAIHLTEQYKALERHGLFIRAVTWTATEQKSTGGGARYEFEAGFESAQATGFTYTPRAVFDRKSDGEFKKTKAVVPPDDKIRLLRLMETAAVTAMSDIVKQASEPEAQTLANDAPLKAANA
jgi:hypothetical protein